MKNRFKLLVLSIIFVFGISCKTDDTSIDQPSSKIEASPGVSKIYNNIGNPYEYIGQQHNAFVDHFYYNHGPDDISGTIDMATIFFKEEYNITLPASITKDQIENDVTYSIEHSITENIQDLKNEGVISDVAFNYLTQLANYVENPVEAEGIDGFVTKIENLEQELVLANLNTSDKELLLPTISVAKYSSNYWKEVYSPTAKTAQKEEPSTWMKAKIAIHVAGVDLNAAIKSFGVFPPFGSAISASAASAIEQRRIDKLWGK